MTDTYLADVSEFQGAINWAAYGAATPGVIVRAHNGWRPDNYWPANRDGARAHVSWRAWYQYLPAGVDPTAAAHQFQATTGPLLPGEVAILDLEEGAGDQRGRRQAWLDALRDPVEWTYSGLAFARAHLPGVPIEWIAAYGQSEPTDSHVMWQFTNARAFPGIARLCDASVFHGSILPGATGGSRFGIGPTTGATLAPTTTPGARMSTLDSEDLTAINSLMLNLLRSPEIAQRFAAAAQNGVWTDSFTKGAVGPAQASDWVTDTRLLVGQLTAQVAALQAAIGAVATGAGGADLPAITAAAEAGAAAALTAAHWTTTVTP
jgi:hypothetical protein